MTASASEPDQTPGASPAATPVFTARIVPGDARFAAPANEPLLAAAQCAGIELRASCRNGTCRSCICKLRSGAVRYAIEWPGLSAEEKRDGFILPCVAYPLGDVELDLQP